MRWRARIAALISRPVIDEKEQVGRAHHPPGISPCAAVVEAERRVPLDDPFPACVGGADLTGQKTTSTRSGSSPKRRAALGRRPAKASDAAHAAVEELVRSDPELQSRVPSEAGTALTGRTA